MTVIDRFDGTKYRFLSNFYMAPVLWEGITYPSSEHAYQAAKTLDPIARRLLANLETAGEVKRAGRRVKMREDWDDVKISVMEDIVRLKFEQHPGLAEKLLSTGDAELIEGNTWGDRFWGVVDGVGENNLGKVLMKVRDEFVAQSVWANYAKDSK